MTITIDRDRAIELLEQAVAQRGSDYVYHKPAALRNEAPTCLYLHGQDGPGCLIALALSLAGVSSEQLGQLDSRTDAAIVTEEVQDYLRSVSVEISDDAYGVFGVAQSRQDYGNTWGEALDAAKKNHALAGAAS